MNPRARSRKQYDGKTFDGSPLAIFYTHQIYFYTFYYDTYKVFADGEFGGYVPFTESSFNEYFVTLVEERNLKIESILK